MAKEYIERNALKKETKKALLIVLALLVVCLALSWAISVSVVYLVCLCFSCNCSLLTATGIWLMACLIYGIFFGRGGLK